MTALVDKFSREFFSGLNPYYGAWLRLPCALDHEPLLTPYSPEKKGEIVRPVVTVKIPCNTNEDKTSLEHLIQHAAHLLPAQGPITAFVHHNTLHAFEDLPFERAVIKGAETFGCHPYLPEERYRQKLARGRICAEDIEAVLIEDLGDRADELLGFLGTRFHLWMAMLAHPLLTGPTAELRWVIAETDALRTFREETPRPIRDRIIADTRHWVMRDLRNGTSHSAGDWKLRELMNLVFERFDKPHLEQWSDGTWEEFTLHCLWFICKDGVLHASVEQAKHPRPIRHRELLLRTTGQDSDRLVQDVLIPFCAAFLDQGFADWMLPNRETGFYESFLELYGQSFAGFDNCGRTLQRELKRLRRERIVPLDSISESLELLGVASDQREEFITETLLALRGYAGMIWQLETRDDRAARPIPVGSLKEFLAVYLILERITLKNIAKETMAYRGSLGKLKAAVDKKFSLRRVEYDQQRAFLVFQLAQLIGWKPELLFGLSPAEWTLLVKEVESFSSLQRRRIYHLAFERHYRIQSLDAISVHCRRLTTEQHEKVKKPSPPFQVICCIDDREESFRRHLEEIDPKCETYSVAGFFAVAMYYQGAADAHFTPLCPVIIKPNHYVREHVSVSEEHSERRRKKTRRAIGTVTHQVHLGSRTFAGGWLAAVLGSLASIPLVARILFPRLTAKLRDVVGSFVRPPAVTQLQLERTAELPGLDQEQIGYSVIEMAAIVVRLWRDIDLVDFSHVVIVCGHGSSSLNNPHESAYNCGACAGAKGGPNARAFAQMANDPRVRQIAAESGCVIPEDTIFVGAYHNTCDDNVTYYDLEQVPSTRKANFLKARDAIDEARRRNAHERCRRFQSAELKITPEAALRHVEGRAEDLSQARPEYNHATNALCLVGRREWSRGLFLDRRAFLQSYNPDKDDENYSVLTRILQAVIPVCAGINLEYYFSCVDPVGWGAGNKLPHNITSLLGVMDGSASDLRPGLYSQMIEIHEAMRLLFVIEATPDAMRHIIDENEGIARLVKGSWVQLATLDPLTSEIQLYRNGNFVPYRPSTDELPEAASSVDWYRGWRDHLGFATIRQEMTQ